MFEKQQTIEGQTIQFLADDGPGVTLLPVLNEPIYSESLPQQTCLVS